MKKSILALILLSSSTLFAQNGRTNRDRNQPSNTAPSTVTASFHRDNPNISENEVNWSQSNNQWRANYKDMSSRNVDAYYDRDGISKDRHTAYEKRDIPQQVDSRVNSRYSANGNYRAVRIEQPNKRTIFQIKIQNGGKDRTVYMDENGNKRKYNDHH